MMAQAPKFEAAVAHRTQPTASLSSALVSPAAEDWVIVTGTLAADAAVRCPEPTAMHLGSRGTNGLGAAIPSLHMGGSLVVGRCAVELVMHTAELARDERQVRRVDPDPLWATDITEFQTREGTVLLPVVIDPFSRMVVGSSIDAA
jgi:transposase InsO family protein